MSSLPKSPIIALKLENKSKGTETIRILHSAIKEDLPKDCTITALIGESYDAILATLAQKKYMLTKIDIFSSTFLNMQKVWKFGYQSQQGAFESYSYIPLSDIAVMQPRDWQVKTTAIQMELNPESFIDIPLIGTWEASCGSEIIVLLYVEPVIPATAQPGGKSIAPTPNA